MPAPPWLTIYGSAEPERALRLNTLEVLPGDLGRHEEALAAIKVRRSHHRAPIRFVSPPGGARPASTYGMVRVGLQHHPLTASAALVWNGDLPRPLQQMLFDAADSLTEPAHQRPADVISLTTA